MESIGQAHPRLADEATTRIADFTNLSSLFHRYISHVSLSDASKRDLECKLFRLKYFQESLEGSATQKRRALTEVWLAFFTEESFFEQIQSSISFWEQHFSELPARCRKKTNWRPPEYAQRLEALASALETKQDAVEEILTQGEQMNGWGHIFSGNKRAWREFLMLREFRADPLFSHLQQLEKLFEKSLKDSLSSQSIGPIVEALSQQGFAETVSILKSESEKIARIEAAKEEALQSPALAQGRGLRICALVKEGSGPSPSLIASFLDPLLDAWKRIVAMRALDQLGEAIPELRPELCKAYIELVLDLKVEGLRREFLQGGTPEQIQEAKALLKEKDPDLEKRLSEALSI